jgi:hypothetical protein
MMMKNITAFLDILGYASTVLVIGYTVTAVILWFRGILPVLLRLGNGLAARKIAIFARAEAMTSLEILLMDSKLFRKKNVLKIPTVGDIGASEPATLFLVYWPDWKDDLQEILRLKRDGTALIVYAPQEHGFIPKEAMVALEKKRNVVVNNFRGRLLNDIVASMITSGVSSQ